MALDQVCSVRNLGVCFARIYILCFNFMLIPLQKFVCSHTRFLLPRTSVCKRIVPQSRSHHSLPRTIAPGTVKDPRGPGTLLPASPVPIPMPGGCSAGGTDSVAPGFLNDMSTGEPSQAPKQNQRVYVPRDGFALINVWPGLLPPTSSCSFPENLQVQCTHTDNYTCVYTYMYVYDTWQIHNSVHICEPWD